MKTQAECENVLRGLVSNAIVRLMQPGTLSSKTTVYLRITAQLSLGDLMEVLPAELSAELQDDLDKAYRQAR